MTINRVTQGMMMDRSYLSLQTGLSRLAKTQEQLSTGRILNRPSDSPTGTTAAMRMRASLADETQYSRNAEDGLGRLGQADLTLSSMLDQVRRVNELAMRSVNTLNQNPAAREALAAEIDQLREGLIDGANATYLGRPVFGGIVNGSAAYDTSGAFVGVQGDVQRTIGKGVRVSVNVDGPEAFGPDGANLFDTLKDLAASVRAGTTTTTQTGMASLDTARNRMTSALAEIGSRTNRLERAAQSAKDSVLDLTSSLSEIENVDLARATMDLKMQEVAYQAALASTARLVQPSLADFLR
ncbi:MAG TPA: flagellin [Marmoricola sp.]|nr:flagellin [Marmoricola sp.]